jgi:hypothetical protein
MDILAMRENAYMKHTQMLNVPSFQKENTMIMSYDAVKDRPALLLAMTSFTQPEFEALLVTFQQVWDAYLQSPEHHQGLHLRCLGGGRKGTTLVNGEDKLLFILYYVKTYPLQEILAFEFGMAQSTANEWIHRLSPVLQEALDRGGFLPERDPDLASALYGAPQDQQYGIDGTERRCQRPRDPDRQRALYSGKKQTHTIKNLIVGGLGSRMVIFLSDTYEGRRHDKAMADREAISYPDISEPDTIDLYQDTGFQGYAPHGVHIHQPTKKPRGKELTPEQKEENTLLARIRIGIEHIIAGMKRCRIVKNVFRNTKNLFDDLVMELACGLHNFRVYHRSS